MTWGMVGAAAVTVVGGYLTKKNQSKNNATAAASDPYGPYRNAAALKLNNLMDNPGSITDTAEYKSRQTAASRMMAAQGYTGSGNALAAVAEAGGQSYQQAFNNLATISGAGQPGLGSNAAQMQIGNNNNAMDQYGQLANGLVGSGINAWNNYQQNRPDPNYNNYNPALQPEPINQPGSGAFDPGSNLTPNLGGGGF
jgi:hypothetical protein